MKQNAGVLQHGVAGVEVSPNLVGAEVTPEVDRLLVPRATPSLRRRTGGAQPFTSVRYLRG